MRGLRLLGAALAGLHTRSLPRGALLGLATTATALCGFYLVVALITDDPHVLWSNRRWLLSGAVSGPLFGAFGAFVRRRAPDFRRVTALVAGILLALEPIVIFSARVVPGWRHVIHWTLDPGPYVAEAVLGLLVLFFAWRRVRLSPNDQHR
ncbi:DUF6518 family protein [Actinoplanes sp. CA-142083]|uniref:DUF6518 family protein n=1 Tax=Actinoplanes sp. CA-142083 TaxID=3239903 RepID=UPI003D8B4788